MKAPHGSRDDLAGRARPPDDGSGDAGADDGERDEGPELDAMRSVWLTMRDEDPPEGGLAELLAAARAKAETMQARPTLWQRLAAGLRRPPALALATVLVLVGGAMLLGRRGLDAPVPAYTRAPSGLAAGSAVSATPHVGGPGSAHPAPAGERAATRAGSGGSAVTPEPAAKLEAAVRQTVTPAPVQSRPAAEAPAADPRAADAAPVVTAAEGSGGVTRNTAASPGSAVPVAPRREPTQAPSREPPASAAAPEGTSTSDDLAGPSRSSHNAPPPPADAGDVAKQAGKKAGNAAEDDEATSTARDKSAPTPGTSPGPSIEQLYKQCEAAAQRGDCAVVRRLVVRITARDRGYRARLAQDSPVGKCLADPAE